MIKLIASDMDGTLVNDQGRINEKMFELIHALGEKGVNFAAASGRFYSQLNENFQKVDKGMIFIAHNGALVKYSNNGKVLYSSCISKEDIQKVASLRREPGMELYLAGEDKAYVVNPSEDLLDRFKFFGVEVVEVESFDAVECPVYKMSYYIAGGVTPAVTEYLRENLGDNVALVVSADCWIDIMNKGVSKGDAIIKLQEKFSISERNTMVFGDYYNDLTMFKTAHYSYAMENAPEDVKKHAKFVAPSNNENGVYNVVHKYAASL